MAIGDRIKQLREGSNLQQKQLAIALDVGQTTISNWESGKQEPNPSQRKKLAEYFKISEAELFADLSLVGLALKTSKFIEENPALLEILQDQEILEALTDPVIVKALKSASRNKQGLKDAFRTLLERFPAMDPEKRNAILALCK